MDTKTYVTLLVTISLAFIGYFVTYFNNLRLAVRKDQLDRIDRQLRDFYGPLFSLNHASDAVFKAFRQKYRPHAPRYWSSPPPPTEEEARAWRLWMREVFFPMISRMEQIIIEHADLIDETEMPPCLLELVTHVSSYRAVLKAWEEGDFSEHTAMLIYPRSTLTGYVKPRYLELKERQARLRRMITKSASSPLTSIGGKGAGGESRTRSHTMQTLAAKEHLPINNL